MKRKILTIDGGGIKGIFAASFLAELEEKCCCRICDYFDMISGTSTGGIIAAALAIGIPANTVLELYLRNGRDIFGKKKIPILRGKYTTEPLKNVITRVFDNKKIRDCQTRLLIPAFDLENRTVRVFKTPHSKDLYFDKDELLVDCILATTAAPIYFKPYKTYDGTFIDGGVGANNPAFIAVVEGMTRCEWDRVDIGLLSIGCVDEVGVTTGREKMGIVDALKVQKCFMAAESQYSENICRLLLAKDNYLRINQLAMQNQVRLDKVDSQAFQLLKNWGKHEAQRAISSIKSTFLETPKDEVTFYNLEGNQ